MAIFINLFSLDDKWSLCFITILIPVYPWTAAIWNSKQQKILLYYKILLCLFLHIVPKYFFVYGNFKSLNLSKLILLILRGIIKHSLELFAWIRFRKLASVCFDWCYGHQNCRSKFVVLCVWVFWPGRSARYYVCWCKGNVRSIGPLRMRNKC